MQRWSGPGAAAGSRSGAVIKTAGQHREHDRAQPPALAERFEKPMLEVDKLWDPHGAECYVRETLERVVCMAVDYCLWR